MRSWDLRLLGLPETPREVPVELTGLYICIAENVREKLRQQDRSVYPQGDESSEFTGRHYHEIEKINHMIMKFADHLPPVADEVSEYLSQQCEEA